MLALSALKAVFTSKLGMAGIALALVLGVFATQRIEIASRDHTIAGYKAAQIVAKADVARHEATAVQISSQASSGLSEAQAAVVVKYRTLIQRVPVDVPEGADRDCVVSQPFIHLWNAGVQP